MTNAFLVAPTDLRDYAKSRGWVLVPDGLRDRLFVLSHPKFDRRQLVFPIDTTAPDYTEAVMLAAEKLALLEGRPLPDVLSALQEVNDDTLRFRIDTSCDVGGALPLAFVGSVVSGAQQLLLAASCTVLKPQSHHPRLSRSEAQQLIEASQFRHTEPGSFVVKVSCPVRALDVQAALFPGEVDAPFVRRTMLTVKRALHELVTAIEADTLSQLIENVQKMATPVISSNLCEALTRFEDDALKNSLEVDISWAISTPLPAGEVMPARIRIQWDYFSRIEEVRRALRSPEQHQEDTFIGTVERLDGAMQPDGPSGGRGDFGTAAQRWGTGAGANQPYGGSIRRCRRCPYD
ncbi:MAG: hypothetical protein JO015_19380 [Verrucomicrobia bacterium]|nr:hypothetical protein [Verrucomicrobiota bacterium]